MGLVGNAHSSLIFDRRVRAIADGIASLLPSDATVLDVGCGDGSVAVAVMAARPDVEVSGVDVLIRPDTQLAVAPFDGETLPYPADSFSAVTLVDVLHHTEDPGRLLSEAARVASSAVIVKDHLADDPTSRPRLKLMDWVGNARFGVRLPYNYLSTRQWGEVLTSTGLTIDAEVDEIGLYAAPFSWIFERRLHLLWRLVS